MGLLGTIWSHDHSSTPRFCQHTHIHIHTPGTIRAWTFIGSFLEDKWKKNQKRKHTQSCIFLFYFHALPVTSPHTTLQIKKRRSRDSNPPKVICLWSIRSDLNLGLSDQCSSSSPLPPLSHWATHLMGPNRGRWPLRESTKSCGWRVLEVALIRIGYYTPWWQSLKSLIQLRFIFGSCKVRCQPGDSTGDLSVMIYLVFLSSQSAASHSGKEKKQKTHTHSHLSPEMTRFTSAPSPRVWLITRPCTAVRSNGKCSDVPRTMRRTGWGDHQQVCSLLLCLEWPGGWETPGLLPSFPFLGHRYTQSLLPRSTLALSVIWAPAKWNWELT